MNAPLAERMRPTTLDQYIGQQHLLAPNASLRRALDAGVMITGCTAHLVSLEVDTGPILVQAAVPVLKEDSPQSLAERIHRQEHRILPQAVQLAAIRLGLL